MDQPRNPGAPLTRRSFVIGVAAATALLARPSLAATLRSPKIRALDLEIIQTGERLRTVYWSDGYYVGGALQEINVLLRDHRTGEMTKIDPRLLDLMFRLKARLETSQPFEIFSGYRSPQTNALLARKNRRVAKHSLHMEGKAVDLRVPGIRVRALRNAALKLRGGGVGYYPQSQFIHIDVGPVRSW
jgi:uncharacterized protein YcbK (DUF882 family)